MATAPKAPVKGATDTSAPATTKKSGSKLIILLIVLIVLLAAGGGAAWYFMGQQGKGEATAKKEPPKPPVFMVIEPFTVNLQPDGAGDQYLQVAFSIQVKEQKDADTIKLYLPQVRSRLLLLLSGKKASEISTVDGKKKLADEIVEQVKQPFVAGEPPLGVTNVFFTSFVIQ